MKLTIKQENFCNYYLETGNASDAYRRAYSCKGMKDETVTENASRLLNDSKIAARVKELQSELKDKSDISKEKTLEELAAIAFSSIGNYFHTWTQTKDFDSISPIHKAAIKSISTKVVKKNIGTSEEPEIVDVEYIKIELHDKIKAIERICKMLGYDETIKIELPEKITIGYKMPGA